MSNVDIGMLIWSKNFFGSSFRRAVTVASSHLAKNRLNVLAVGVWRHPKISFTVSS